MDTENPAVSRHTHIPPQLLEDVSQSPDKFEPVARAMAVVHMDALYRKMMDKDTPVAARLDFQKMLNKMSRLEPEAKNQGGGGAGVVINITRAKDHESVTIEGQAISPAVLSDE